MVETKLIISWVKYPLERREAIELYLKRKLRQKLSELSRRN